MSAREKLFHFLKRKGTESSMDHFSRELFPLFSKSMVENFLFARTDQRDDMSIRSINLLWIVNSACLAVSKALI